MADRVSQLAGGPLFFLAHIVWFAVWISANDEGIFSFDPPPFNLLMLVVSLEAIVLTGFVLRAQSRMAMTADRRAQLDLQVNLLAEQELTAILRVLCSVGDKIGIDVAGADPRVEQFRSQTDVRAIAAELERQKAVVDAIVRSSGLDARRAKYYDKHAHVLDGQGRSLRKAQPKNGRQVHFKGTTSSQDDANKIWDDQDDSRLARECRHQGESAAAASEQTTR